MFHGGKYVETLGHQVIIDLLLQTGECVTVAEGALHIKRKSLGGIGKVHNELERLNKKLRRLGLPQLPGQIWPLLKLLVDPRNSNAHDIQPTLHNFDNVEEFMIVVETLAHWLGMPAFFYLIPSYDAVLDREKLLLEEQASMQQVSRIERELEIATVLEDNEADMLEILQKFDALPPIEVMPLVQAIRENVASKTLQIRLGRANIMTLQANLTTIRMIDRGRWLGLVSMFESDCPTNEERKNLHIHLIVCIPYC